MSIVIAHYHGCFWHAFVTREKFQFKMVITQKQGKKKPAPSATVVHLVRQVTFDASAMTASSLTDKLPVLGTSVTMTASSLTNKLPGLGPLNENDIECPPERSKGGHSKGITNAECSCEKNKKYIEHATVAACKRYKQERDQAIHHWCN
jgi:hypothetical protein